MTEICRIYFYSFIYFLQVFQWISMHTFSCRPVMFGSNHYVKMPVDKNVHAQIWCKSYTCYCNRMLPKRQTVHFIMNTLSIKTTLIIYIFAILKHYCNYLYYFICIDTSYGRWIYIHWCLHDELNEQEA